MKQIKRSTIIPLTLLAYLAVMSVFGFDYFKAGNYLYYFGIIGVTLFIIILLHFTLKKKEKLQQKHKDEAEGDKKEP